MRHRVARASRKDPSPAAQRARDYDARALRRHQTHDVQLAIKFGSRASFLVYYLQTNLP